MANRENANFNTVYTVKGALEIDAWSERETYTVAEKPVFRLLVRSTDEPWRLLGPENDVSAAVYVYSYENIVEDVPAGEPIWESSMSYDPVGEYLSEK